MNFEKMTLRPADEKEFANQFHITIEADTNDADYITETSVLEENEIENYIVPLQMINTGIITAIGDCSHDNNNRIPDEIMDYARELIPYGEYGVHSVVIDEFIYYDGNGKKFYVELEDQEFPEYEL